MGLLRWLFGPPPDTAPQSLPAEALTPPRKLALREATFDPDGNQSDLEWRGFHIYDERGMDLSYAEAEELGLHIFRGRV